MSVLGTRAELSSVSRSACSKHGMTGNGVVGKASRSTKITWPAKSGRTVRALGVQMTWLAESDRMLEASGKSHEVVFRPTGLR